MQEAHTPSSEYTGHHSTPSPWRTPARGACEEAPLSRQRKEWRKPTRQEDDEFEELHHREEGRD